MMDGHSIHLSIGDGGMELVEWRCDNPLGKCHYSCSKPQCEEGCVGYDDDTGEPHTADEYSRECLLVTWLSEGGTWDEQYKGPTTEIRSGPIEITWDGDYYTWSYAGEAVAS